MNIRSKATGRYIKPLTNRQDEILSLVRQGKTNAEISIKLGISQNTVSQHIKMICDKLKLSTRDDLKKQNEGE